MKTIGSEIRLWAPAEAVGEALTDFDSYPEWNPFVVRINAELAPGSRFRAMSRLPAGLKLRFVGTIEQVTPVTRLQWVGRPTIMPAAAMEVRHIFQLEATGAATILSQLEEAAGFMIPISGWILGQAQRGQIELNKALAASLDG